MPHDPSQNAANRDGAVLLVANYASDVGYAWWLMENFWSVIAREMAAQGRPCILAYPKIAAIPPLIGAAPLRIVERKIDWRASADTLRFLRDEGVRSVYLTDWPYVHWTYALWRTAGVRRIVLHDHKPGDRPPASTLKRIVHGAVHASALGACTHYVGVSNYVGERLQENSCVPRSRCLVVENGIELFEPERSRRAAVRESLGVAQDAVLIVLVSRATVYKGLDFLVQCLARLHADAAVRDKFHVVHCGDGPDMERFRGEVRSAGMAAQVQFLGRRSDVRQILAAADLAFHPSRGEGLSLAILEFMCAGLPVVVPDRRSVCAPVEHEVTGLVYRAEDHAAACAALTRLIGDAALRARLGTAAQRRCAERFSLQMTNESFSRQVVPLL